MSERIDEEGLRDRLRAVVGNGVRDAKDRALYGMGSRSAKGRLDISAATKHLFGAWREYVGREAAAGNKSVARNPTLADLHDFLQSDLEIDIGADKLEQIAAMHDGEEGEEAAQLVPQDAQPEQPQSQEPQDNPAANDANDPDSLGPLYPNQGRVKKAPPPKPAKPGSAQAGLDRFSKFRQPEKPNFQTPPAAPAPARSTFGQRGAAPTPARSAPSPSFGRRGVAPTAANDAAPTADSRARAILSNMKATSPGEYNALRAKFAKSQGGGQQDDLAARRAALRAKMNRAANESVVMEATSPDQITFDPRKVFPKIANVLIKQGLLRVNRKNGQVSGGGGQGSTGASADGGADNKAANANGERRAELNSDGHAIDAEKMKRILERDKVNGEKMDIIKQAVAKGDLLQAMRDRNAVSTMVSIADAVLHSIDKQNAPGKIAAVQTTSTGTTIDFNVFEKSLADQKIKGAAVTKLRSQLDSAGEDAIKSSLLTLNSNESKLLCAIVTAAIKAMSTSAPKK